MHGTRSRGILPRVLLFQRSQLNEHCGGLGLDVQY